MAVSPDVAPYKPPSWQDPWEKRQYGSKLESEARIRLSGVAGAQKVDAKNLDQLAFAEDAKYDAMYVDPDPVSPSHPPPQKTSMKAKAASVFTQAEARTSTSSDASVY